MTKNEVKDKLVGFYVTRRGKSCLEYMAQILWEKGLIRENSISEAGRWCLDVGWTIVSSIIDAEAEGKRVEYVTIPIKPKIFEESSQPQPYQSVQT